MRPDNCILNYSFTVLFSFVQRCISFGIFGSRQTFEDTQRPCLLCGLPQSMRHYMCKYGVGEMREKEEQNGVSTVNSGRTGDSGLEEAWREWPAVPTEAMAKSHLCHQA